MYLGLDIGSSSSKAVLLGENQESLAAQVVNLGTGTKGVRQVLEAVYRQAGIGPEEVRYTVVTGYGRMTYQGADRQITEISCHAKGVFSPLLFCPNHCGCGRARHQGHSSGAGWKRGELRHERQMRRRDGPFF